MTTPDRRPPEPRAIDLADPDQVRAVAAQLEVEPADVEEAVAQVGPNLTAVALWLTAPPARP